MGRLRLIDQYASDEKVAVEFENLLYSDSNRDTLRYLLCILDYHFVSYHRGLRDANLIPNENHNHLIDTLDIEHIYAQNHNYDPELNNDVNKIGNLTFWGDTDNRSSRDALFDVKKDSYLDSSVRMTQSLGELDEWTHIQFKERHDMILDMIKCIFYLY